MNAKGFVEFGRVNGNLALSRAVGDFEFKNNKGLPAEEQIVTGMRRRLPDTCYLRLVFGGRQPQVEGFYGIYVPRGRL